ncbi:MAG: tRNA uridine-5-carboxymethylaminomethyl(34) synthesis GTPase MnmE [Thermomicrobiales bacterium]
MNLDFSTIAAISTPPGTGGIGVIRTSGPEAALIAARIFRKPNGQALDLRAIGSHRVIFGRIHDPATGSAIDEVLLTWMAAPHTFTTEDTVEISCHGGQMPLQETLRVVLASGARLAEPGEFTLRAFLHGRLDLSQAEAVLNVIGARTPRGLELAVEDLRGEIARRIAPARDAVVSLLAYLDAAADFPEDEIPGTDVDADLSTALTALESIVAGSHAGMLFREGAQVALVGRPNVGKSSLMNALLRSDRAIVTPIAGTTRDVIAESCNINGIPVTLLDTAGIGDTEDIVEQLGIARSRKAMEGAAAIVFVLDGSVAPTGEDFQVANMLSGSRFDENTARPGDGAAALGTLQEPAPTGASDGATFRNPVIVAINKHDLPSRESQRTVLDLVPDATAIQVSSRTGEGLPTLQDALAKMLGDESAIQPSLITTRQRAALERSLEHLRNASETRAAGFPLDLMATDVRAALHAIGEVTGENIDEAVLTEIFSRFCIGK